MHVQCLIKTKQNNRIVNNFSCKIKTEKQMAAAPGNLAAYRIPAAPSLVVSGLKRSASRVTEHKGRASATHTAVERPTTPAPTTATRTPFFILQEGESRRRDRCPLAATRPATIDLVMS